MQAAAPKTNETLASFEICFHSLKVSFKKKKVSRSLVSCPLGSRFVLSNFTPFRFQLCCLPICCSLIPDGSVHRSLVAPCPWPCPPPCLPVPLVHTPSTCPCAIKACSYPSSLFLLLFLCPSDCVTHCNWRIGLRHSFLTFGAVTWLGSPIILLSPLGDLNYLGFVFL